MKALSVRQPYAWLIVNGIKDIENRTWRTGYRGPVLIHASKNYPKREHADDAVDFRLHGFPVERDAMVGGIAQLSKPRVHARCGGMASGSESRCWRDGGRP